MVELHFESMVLFSLPLQKLSGFPTRPGAGDLADGSVGILWSDLIVWLMGATVFGLSLKLAH